ncbi:LLM class flavin-dependent oxidoreductase, partial [Pseudomonas sp. DCB_AW]|nr:LLM class flavin-dependent oxidoreductase [Pseudomonas sp. DCB_AW]
MTTRQIKLGALTMGGGGPGRQNLGLDPELPAAASVNIDWDKDIAR